MRLKNEIENKSKFYKGPRTKIKNQKNKCRSENPHKSEANEILHGPSKFSGNEREKKKKSITCDKSCHQHDIERVILSTKWSCKSCLKGTVSFHALVPARSTRLQLFMFLYLVKD